MLKIAFTLNYAMRTKNWLTFQKKSHLVLVLNIVYTPEEKCNTSIFWILLFA